MSKKPLTRAELKRLEQLQKQLEIKESKLNVQEAKLKKQQTELESEQRKLATDKRQFANERKQFKQDKDDSKSSRSLTRPKSTDRPFSAQKSKKLKDDYNTLKKKHEHFAKLMRDYKKKADQLEAENKVLRRRVENANSKKPQTNDKQLRGIMKENRWLKKKLRELMKDLAKQKRWYARVVKIFKDNNNKWVQKKIEAYKDKEYIIKYVFLDDIKRIVLTRPGHDRNGFKPRVRIKNGRGGEVVLRNVGIDVFDQKVRKIDRGGKRDRKGGNGGGTKGKNTKDVITKQRPGKDGKNIIKTKYVDTGEKEAITKEKAGKKGDKSGNKNKNATPTPDAAGNAKNRKKSGAGGTGTGNGTGSGNDKGKGKGNRKEKDATKSPNASETDPVTSEFLKTDAEAAADAAAGDTGADGNDAGNGADADNENNVDAKENDEDEWETLADAQDDLDDYMIEFLQELGITVTKEDLDKFEEKFGDDDEETDAQAEAKLDKEYADALKKDKDLMFDGDDAGSPEMQAQIMYLIGEIDSRNDDLKQLKDIANGVQYVSKADAGGNEEDMEEKELKTEKDKLDAIQLVFESIEKRQETFLASLEDLNCDTDSLRDINNTWYDEYKTLAKMAVLGGGGSGSEGGKYLEKLRYFVDYFMKELIGRIHDLRCVNAAFYNQGIESVTKVEKSGDDDETDSKDAESKEEENVDSGKPVFEVLQSGIDVRHSSIQEVVSNDEVMNSDNSDDKVASEIESVLNEFLGNMDDWKSLIEETKQKHETWIETRGNLFNALFVRHNEIGELMDKINHVPSYSMNLQKYMPKEEDTNDNVMSDNDNDNENENENENENDS